MYPLLLCCLFGIGSAGLLALLVWARDKTDTKHKWSFTQTRTENDDVIIVGKGEGNIKVEHDIPAK